MNGDFYVDVHAHLTDKSFASDIESVIQRAEASGLGAIVVNGLDPDSNKETMALSERYKIVKPAWGIYPIHAVNHLLPDNFSLPVKCFDVDDAIAQIEQYAAAGRLSAVGECGLDAYWLDESTFAAQEAVFERLVDIATRHKLPIIIHSRKLEERCFAIMAESHAPKVIFHCYGGKVKHALRVAEQHGWHFSIPANINKSQSFQKMARDLPLALILTETDCPYLGPVAGERNEPKHVVGTVEAIATLRGLSIAETNHAICSNFKRLFAF